MNHTPIYRILLVSLLLTATYALAAPTSYYDNFESATLNPFWTTLQQYGTVSLTNSANHTPGGNQSLALSSFSGGQRYIQLIHNFGEEVKGKFSVWFYDVAPGRETLYEQLVLINSVTGASTGIGTQDFDAYCYMTGIYDPPNNYGPNQNCGIYPQITTTNIGRTGGWHNLVIDVGAHSMNWSIDGTSVFFLAGDYSFDTVQLNESGPYWRPDTYSYWDDFSYDAPVPEPGTLVMLGTGLLSAVSMLRRKLM